MSHDILRRWKAGDGWWVQEEMVCVVCWQTDKGVVAMYGKTYCQRVHLRCPLVIMCDCQRAIINVCVGGPRRALSVGYTHGAHFRNSLHF